MSREYVRQSYDLVPETCPAIDSAVEHMVGIIKTQTSDLRDALVETIERADKAEDIVDNLKNIIADREDTINKLDEIISNNEESISNLHDIIRSLSNELDTIQDQYYTQGDTQ